MLRSRMRVGLSLRETRCQMQKIRQPRLRAHDVTMACCVGADAPPPGPPPSAIVANVSFSEVEVGAVVAKFPLLYVCWQERRIYPPVTGRE